MPKALALNTIHLGREPGVLGEKGAIVKHAVVDEYKAGDIIVDCPQKQFDELKAINAVREVNAVDEAAAEARGYVDPAVARARLAGETIAVKQPDPPKQPESPKKPEGSQTGQAGENLLG